MYCSTHRRGATQDLLVLLLYVFLMILSVTQAEEINNHNMNLARSMKSDTKSMCLRQLNSSTPLKTLLRMYVRPIGPGSNKIYIAGTVHVRTEDLEVGGDWVPLHYEYTSLDKEVYLNVTQKGKPLQYIPIRSMYHLRYDLEAVKMYVKGRVEILDEEDCSQLETASTTTATFTITELNNKAAQQLEGPDSITVPPDVTIPSTPAASAKPGSGDQTSGIWVMGAAGSIPILIILVVLLVSLVLVVVGIVSFFLWRRRRAATTTSSRNKDPFAACRDPLMPQPQTADQFPTNNTNVSPIYRSPPPPPPPNYYSE